jgi:hypothetical protein
VSDVQVETTLDERTDVRLDHGDHERLAHIIRKDDQMRAYVLGEEVVALCGKRWVPSRDPDRFPVCPECRSALEFLRAGGAGGGAGGGDRR